MKLKLLFILTTLLLSCPMLAQQSSTKRVAILETIDKEKKVPYGLKLMVRSKLCTFITATPGYEGYDRVDVSSILKEHDFQRTGLVSEKDIKRLGEMVGADYILLPETSYLDDAHIFISAKIVNVETAQVTQIADVQSTTSAESLEQNCKILAGKLLNVNPETGAVIVDKILEDGARYVGEFVNGKCHGHGILYRPNSNIARYDGEWVDGKRHGFGTAYHSNGKVWYKGNWEEGKWHGFGTEYYRNGELLYEGEHNRGFKQGKGHWWQKSTIKSSFKSYEGEFYQEHFHGFGKAITPKGAMHVCEWKYSEPYGEGTVYPFTVVDGERIYPHKSHYVTGHYHNGQMDGEWRHYQDGILLEILIYKDGECIRTKRIMK